jgi:hypothetical protein
LGLKTAQIWFFERCGVYLWGDEKSLP